MTRRLAGMLVGLGALAGCEGSEPPVPLVRGCTTIAQAAVRLACFDHAAGTPRPASPESPTPSPEPPAPRPDTFYSVTRNEARRATGQTGPLWYADDDDLPGQRRFFMSIPASHGAGTPTYLVIGCYQNISRLQLLLPKPLEGSGPVVSLALDGRPLAPAYRWLVLEDGSLLDAGRGLVAIDLLRTLVAPGKRLTVSGNLPELNGLVFDAQGLSDAIAAQRRACHW